MYSIDGHNLEELGFLASRSENSNMAILGAWDMPVRTGKTHHSWAEVDEPYLRKDEIFFAGRDIGYSFFTIAETREHALDLCYNLFDLLGSFDNLKQFDANGYGIFDVYVKDEIIIEYIGDGICRGVIPFRQPIVDLEGTILNANNVAPAIDGISFSQFGITVLDIKNEFNRPAPKDGKITAYGSEGYHIGKTGFRSINLNLLIEHDDYSSFQSSVQSFIALLASPNARTLNINGTVRECFAKDGFKFTSIYQEGSGYFGTIDLKLTEIRVLSDYTIFSDASGNILTDGNGVPLSEIFKQQ